MEGIIVRNPRTGKMVRTKPFTYDFEDYDAKLDYTKMFVSKLMHTQNGQCHSLPLLYLILAEQVGTEAWLSMAPDHSYIQIKDNRNRLLNMELTTGHLASDASMMASDFVTSAALRNHLYMDTLSRKQLLGEMFSDLAKGYFRKFGYDPFVKQCIISALYMYPNCITALTNLSNYNTNLLRTMLRSHSVPLDSNTLRKYPYINDQFLKVNQIYQRIDDLGYQEMPKEKYEAWLDALRKEKQRVEDEQAQQMLLKKVQMNTVKVNR
jgi:hypothetical protein